MKITKKQLKKLIKEETKKVLEMHDLDDEYGGGAYTSPGPPRGGMKAHAPRTGESVDLGGEIVRLAQEAGVEPYEYLIGLGFGEESADNLLGMTNLLDQVKGGMTFRENRSIKEEEELEDASTGAWEKQHDANKIVWDSIRELAKHYRALAKNDVTGLMSEVVDEYMKHFRAGFRPKNQKPHAIEELEEKFIVAVAYAWASINSK